MCAGSRPPDRGPVDRAPCRCRRGIAGGRDPRQGVGAGALWQDVVEATRPHGLSALHGSAPDVGVAGYTLGGGMGWLARRHGLQCNHLLAAELVTADGEIVRTDAQRDPEL